jgi:hypothetical protein
MISGKRMVSAKATPPTTMHCCTTEEEVLEALHRELV